MIYRGPGFLHIQPFGSSSIPFPPLPSASCLSFSVLLRIASRAHLRVSRGYGDGAGAKSYDGEKGWSSINHSVLSDVQSRFVPQRLVKF
jgi:hypothetical protein